MPMSSKAARALREAQQQNRHHPKGHFDQGYFKTPQAAVWQGEPAAPKARQSTMSIRWAKRSLNRKEGAYVAVGLKSCGEGFVLIESHKARSWKPWKDVEHRPGVKEWVKNCF